MRPSTLVALGVAGALASAAARARAEPADPWLGRDKALHFGACATLAGGGYVAGRFVWDDRLRPALLGAGLAVGAGAAKEGLDAAGLGDPSWRDFTWDLAGAAVGLGLALAIDALVTPAPKPARAR